MVAIDVLRHFKNFYSRNQVNVDSIAQREFGIGTTKKINYRHKSFSTQKEFQNFLVSETPRFISHSVGRFEFPWSQPMERKTLLSADLIFDLDAKPEVEQNSSAGKGHNKVFCKNCVEQAKQDTIRLIENFLLPDFGFTKNDLLIVFSGSKGFHVHIRSPLVQSLSSTARRLMVDYITGKELELETLVTAKSIESRVSTLTGPKRSSKGYWQKHFFAQAIAAIQNNDLGSAGGLTRRKARFLAENKQLVVSLLESGNWDFFHGCEDILEDVLRRTISKHGVQVDSPVTFDVHRLIRVPGTLHGDTGFVAKHLTLSELSSFEATKNAAVFSGSAEVLPREDARVEFASQVFELNAGQAAVVPLSLAVLLACKGATL